MRGHALQGAFAHFCVGIKVGCIVKKPSLEGGGGRRSLTDEVIYEVEGVDSYNVYDSP